MQLTLQGVRQDRGALGSGKEWRPHLCPAPASGRAQVRVSTAPSPSPTLLPSSGNSGNSKDNANTFLLCTSTSCLCGRGCGRNSWSSPCFSHCQWPRGQLVPIASSSLRCRPCRDLTRTSCTLAISSTRRSPPREKNPQVSPSEQASPAQRGRTEELLFFFF